MGLAFTVDTPIKVARFGISSVISIIEDRLIELMRRHYYSQIKRPYRLISDREEDYRARRITDYLNLVNEIVASQLEKLKQGVFEKGSELTKYFEMLPPTATLKQLYERMIGSTSTDEKLALQAQLRQNIRAGSIDVNIMTKVDKNNFDREGNQPPDSSDAVAALRGYANSNLKNSSIIFSAGLNPRLFNYLERTRAFDPTGYGAFDKRIVIKVSDYRSALIQGKYLAKKGIWVSEFRVESGLNCGGHAFATDGTLLGSILEEFKTKKDELAHELFKLYRPAAKERGCAVYPEPHPINVSAQGGIGTYDEARFLTERYNLSSAGWGTPFLLCPEATTVDDNTLHLLARASAQDVVLSRNSPLGVRFYYLKGTSAEKEKESRIRQGKPGSPCTEKHLVSNTEFTEKPICTASRAYQTKKIAQLRALELPAPEFQRRYGEVVSKECLCVGLMNSAVHVYALPRLKKLEAVTVCPGPNIIHFNKIVTLREMVDHIYGRVNILSNQDRPHMFINELNLNVGYLAEQLAGQDPQDERKTKEIISFGTRLLDGIQYYRELADEIAGNNKTRFLQQLDECAKRIRPIITSLATPAVTSK